MDVDCSDTFPKPSEKLIPFFNNFWGENMANKTTLSNGGNGTTQDSPPRRGDPERLDRLRKRQQILRFLYNGTEPIERAAVLMEEVEERPLKKNMKHAIAHWHETANTKMKELKAKYLKLQTKEENPEAWRRRHYRMSYGFPPNATLVGLDDPKDLREVWESVNWTEAQMDAVLKAARKAYLRYPKEEQSEPSTPVESTPTEATPLSSSTVTKGNA
ncbi:MAG: hypothetical protein LBJ61_08490 [Deltaproteobacteria bacterium]|nr:hypothetical protein [Deltaproteobacteria bacterium]